MKLLTELYKIPAKTGNEEQIKSFILENVKDIPMQVITDEIGNLFFIKGTAESYPCVAAHLDEVQIGKDDTLLCPAKFLHSENIEQKWV